MIETFYTLTLKLIFNNQIGDFMAVFISKCCNFAIESFHKYNWTQFRKLCFTIYINKVKRL